MRPILSITACVLVALSAACITNRGNAGSNPPPTPYPDLEVCYNATTTTTGYIRTGSRQELRADCPQTSPGHLNILIFKRYDNLPVGSSLIVCADQQPPASWQDISGGYHDTNGCDAVAHPDSAFANVRKIYRAQ